MTNLLFSTFLYANSIGLSETKIDYGARLEYQLKPKYSIGVQINNHANDSVIDGADIYVTREIYKRGLWKSSGYFSVGRNIEDKRLRNAIGYETRFVGWHSLVAQASVGYQREFGDWKNERKPNAMITQLGIGWRF